MMLRLFLFAISFALLVSSMTAVLDYWQYDDVMQDVATLMADEVTAESLAVRVELSIDNDRPEDARMYLAIADTFGYTLDPGRFLPRIKALETPWHVARRRFADFASGFLEGEAETASGIAGAVTADFTVIGDARDLYEQYDIHQRGGNVNELIVTLAGVGIGLTAATVMTSGSVAPVKGGASALKLASRTGKLTPRLQRILLRQGKDVFDYRAFLLAARSEKSLDNIRQAAVKAYNPRALKALGETTERVNNIRKSSSLADTVDMLRYVETTDDLRRLEKVSLKYGTETKGILRLLGKGVIGTVRVLRNATEILVGLVATLLSVVATVLSMSGFFMQNKQEETF